MACRRQAALGRSVIRGAGGGDRQEVGWSG